MADQPGILTKSWYLFGVLIWKKNTTLTLQEQAGLIKTEQIKEKIYNEMDLVLDKALKVKGEQIKEEILKEINEGFDKILNPK